MTEADGFQAVYPAVSSGGAAVQHAPKLTAEQVEIAALRSQLALSEARGLEALAKLYSPGQWHCQKCNFRLTQSVLSMADGQVYAQDKPGEPCPNCQSPLWRVSWEGEAREAIASSLRSWDEKQEVIKERDAALAQVSALRLSTQRFADLCHEIHAGDASAYEALDVAEEALANTNAADDAYRARIRDEALEEAAGIADGEVKRWDDAADKAKLSGQILSLNRAATVSEEIAAMIRAAKGAKP